MSSKLPWTRLFADKWAIVVDYLPPVEGNIYMRLRFRMLRTGEPLFCNIKVLSHYTGYSLKKFEAALNVLLEEGYIVRLADGRLWSLDVEEELKEFSEKKEHISQVRSKAGKKGGQAKTHIKQSITNFSEANDDFVEANAKQNVFFAKANNDFAETNDAEQKEKKIPPHTPLKENKNINKNKKTNTIVLSKKEKEIGSENSETIDLVDELTEVDVLERQPEQIAVVAETQPSLHEPENIPKKAERSKAKRGCRLPEDFEPDYAFAIAEGLSPECVKVEIAKFRDYWRSKSGANATKTDWPATWRNWIRNSKSYGNSKIGGNYGNNSQRQKSIGERIADCVLDIGNRGYFEANSRNDSSGISLDFENWQCVNETARNDGIRSF
ncbi:hypothetical protein V3564_05005 [Bartonella sp. B12(2025)]